MEVLKGLTSTKALSEVYPVGSIYMSTEPTSPASLFGGSWTQLEGRFLLGAGTGKDENNLVYTFAAGTQNGEYQHKLTIDEIPSHTHYMDQAGWSGGSDGVGRINYTQKAHEYDYYTQATGGDGYHYNMPPYLAVYMWKRTA